jgi:hypothetical protein
MTDVPTPLAPDAALSQLGAAKYGLDLQIKRLRGTAGLVSPLHDAEYLLVGAKRFFDLAVGVNQGSSPTPELTRALSDPSLPGLRDRIKRIRDTIEHWVEYGQHIGIRQKKQGEPPGSFTVKLHRDAPDIPISYLSTTVTINEIEAWSRKVWTAAHLDLSP